MALLPARLKGAYISVLVGNGANPEVFEKLCGATSRGITIQKNTTDDTLAPCDDPEATPYRTTQVNSVQWDMALNIIYNRTQAGLIRDLIQETAPRNFRFEFTEPTVAGKTENGYGTVDAGYWAGAGLMTNLSITGAGEKEFATGTVSIISDGPFEWVEA